MCKMSQTYIYFKRSNFGIKGIYLLFSYIEGLKKFRINLFFSLVQFRLFGKPFSAKSKYDMTKLTKWNWQIGHGVYDLSAPSLSQNVMEVGKVVMFSNSGF